MFIAIKLDNKMSKKEILQRYLNTSWFGRGAYGIERASWAYYGKDASELTPSEGAFIASLLKGAGLYDPAVSRANHRRAVERWGWVLDRMVATGHLSQRERAAYRTFPEPHDPPKSAGLDGQTGYLVDTARAYVSAHSPISDKEFDLGGYQVHTTFEKPRVAAMAGAVKKELKGVRGTAGVRAGAASVSTGGRILALYGGPGYVEQGFNDANITIVPAGTTFLPFVLASGMENGVLKQRGEPRTPVDGSTLYDGDDKVAIRTPEGPYWDRGGRVVKGANDGGRSWGQISLRDALAESVNAPFMQLGMDVGLDRVTATATRAGLRPAGMGARVPAFSLGNSTPSPIRLASAYGTFADRGVHVEPFSVDRIDRHGATVFHQEVKGTRVMAAATAATVTEGLRDSVEHGAGHAAAAAGPGAAGKPGVAEDEVIGAPVASWFAGYRGEVSTAVAFFRVDPKKQELVALKGPGVSGISPTRVWTRVMSSRG
ncbi:transglycosylase domain-containing protein [Streptomyces sp. MI02-7b]|uniref:transglycosylase domain-containing protein n=1 Tax=Streptomyces sp. MI02-7b TaxID=462941 RepID=UPI0029CAA2A6|nr:transglycosylase domain-containing protein [Streptomyces sp. MI02-7b]